MLNTLLGRVVDVVAPDATAPVLFMQGRSGANLLAAYPVSV